KDFTSMPKVTKSGKKGKKNRSLLIVKGGRSSPLRLELTLSKAGLAALEKFLNGREVKRLKLTFSKPKSTDKKEPCENGSPEEQSSLPVLKKSKPSPVPTQSLSELHAKSLRPNKLLQQGSPLSSSNLKDKSISSTSGSTDLATKE